MTDNYAKHPYYRKEHCKQLRQYYLPLWLMYRLPFKLTDSAKLLHFTVLGGSADPPCPPPKWRHCRHEPVLYQNDWRNRAGFWQGGFLLPITPEIWVSPKIKGTSLWDFDTNSGPRKFRCGKSIALLTNSSSSTVELVDDTYTTVDESWLFTTCRSTVTLWLHYRDLS